MRDNREQDFDNTFHFDVRRVAFIYHLAKESPLRRANTVAGGLGSALLSTLPSLPSMDSPDTGPGTGGAGAGQ